MAGEGVHMRVRSLKLQENLPENQRAAKQPPSSNVSVASLARKDLAGKLDSESIYMIAQIRFAFICIYLCP